MGDGCHECVFVQTCLSKILQGGSQITNSTDKNTNNISVKIVIQSSILAAKPVQ